MKLPFKKALMYVGVLSLLSGCASSYNTIRPEGIAFNNKSEANGIALEYRYNVLSEHENKKYAKKEMKNHMQLVAVKLTNNSDRAVMVPQDLNIYTGENKLMPTPVHVVHSTLKQGVPIYLLYMLLTFTKLTTSSNGVVTSSYPIGLILGPGITALNMVKASSANKAFLQDLENYNLANKQLQPGESIYGLVGISNGSFSPLTLKPAQGAY